MVQDSLTEVAQLLRDLLQPERSSISQIKEYIETTASALTLFAVIIGGIWTYMLFVKTRQKYPSGNISQVIQHRTLSETMVWLRVTITIQNTGKVLLSLVRARTWVQQILPADEDIMEKVKEYEQAGGDKIEIQWPALDDKVIDWAEGDYVEIEPGEQDQIIFDFILEREVQTVVAYSYLKNITKRKREIGWSLTTTYDLRPSEGGDNDKKQSGDCGRAAIAEAKPTEKRQVTEGQGPAVTQTAAAAEEKEPIAPNQISLTTEKEIEMGKQVEARGLPRPRPPAPPRPPQRPPDTKQQPPKPPPPPKK